jgi:hypothetical protein
MAALSYSSTSLMAFLAKYPIGLLLTGSNMERAEKKRPRDEKIEGELGVF